MRLLAPIIIATIAFGCAEDGEYTFDMGVAGQPRTEAGLPPVMNGGAGGNQVPVQDANLPPVSDAFVPPMMNPRRDAGPTLSTPEALQMCVTEMSSVLHGSYFTAGCDEYSDEARGDFDSAYHMEPVVAACVKLTCEGVVVEGHNGIPATRSCGQIMDLRLVLENAAEEAIAGNCNLPIYQMRVLTLQEFVGLEPCDGYTCGIDDEGNPIAIDNQM